MAGRAEAKSERDSMTVEEFLTRLDRVKPHGDYHMALCPVHEDNRESLSIKQGDGGKIVLKCHAGCGAREICAALGLTMSDLFPPKDKPEPKSGSQRTLIARYSYKDEEGKLLFEALRYQPKEFRQRAPDGKGGWLWKLDGVRRVPYNLPKVIEQAKAGKTIFVVEGEKDADALNALGLTATTNAGGAGKWLSDFGKYLTGCHVVILPDNDEPGKKHAFEVAASCLPHAASVRIVELPGLQPKADTFDWLKSGGAAPALLDLAKAAPVVKPEDLAASQEPKLATEIDEEEGGKQSAASWMLSYIRNNFELWLTPDSIACATANSSPRKTLLVKSSELRREISKAFLMAHGKPATPAAIQTTVEALDALASDGKTYQVHKRKADMGEAIYLDLGGPDWQAVKITKNGWEIIDNPPVRFRRTPGMLPMPTPERGGSIADLHGLVNVTEEQFPLLVGWLLAALGPHRPYPILAVSGEQGSAKSSLSRMARRLVDPATLELRRLSYEIEDLAVAVNGSFVVAFDNISGVSGEFSDVLAMIATGGGFGRRKRHTDTEETIVHVKSPLILNGIGEPATRPDLLDRCLMLHLPTIPEYKRQLEAEIEAAFATAWPKLLGALLDAVVMGLQRLSDVRLDRLPRMADFGRWMVACEPACPWEPGAFMASYDTNREEAVEIGLEASPLAAVIVKILGEEWTDPETRQTLKPKGMWEGTAEELRLAVSERVTEISQKKLLPVNARALSTQLKRISPALRASGYAVTDRMIRGKTHWAIREANKDPESGGQNVVGKIATLPLDYPEGGGQKGKNGQNPYIYTHAPTLRKKEEIGEESSKKSESIVIGGFPILPTLPTTTKNDIDDPFAPGGSMWQPHDESAPEYVEGEV
jgi:hypothetical protein